MTIKARKAAATMLSELEAETDAIRQSISDEMQFSNSTILTLTESREEELRALDGEFEKRKTRLRKTYAELIRNEERRIALYKAQLEKLDGPQEAPAQETPLPIMETVGLDPNPPMIGHNSGEAVRKSDGEMAA